MAKKLILFSLLILSFIQVSKGQRVRFYGGMEYYPQNSAKIRQDLQIGGKLYDILLSYRGGDYSIEMGAEYNPYNQICVYSSVYTEMDAISLLKWAPVNGRYTIGAKYKFKMFEFGIEHSCYHPIRVYEYKETDPQMYGGYTKFSIKFSTKYEHTDI